MTVPRSAPKLPGWTLPGWTPSGTPIGRFAGALAGSCPDDPAAHVVRSVIARSPVLDTTSVGVGQGLAVVLRAA